jgi:hypothetical protein
MADNANPIPVPGGQVFPAVPAPQHIGAFDQINDAHRAAVYPIIVEVLQQKGKQYLFTCRSTLFSRTCQTLKPHSPKHTS